MIDWDQSGPHVEEDASVDHTAARIKGGVKSGSSGDVV